MPGVINAIQENDKASFEFVYCDVKVKGRFRKNIFTPHYLELCKNVPTNTFLSKLIVDWDVSETLTRGEIEDLFTKSEFQPTGDVPITIVGTLCSEKPCLKTLIAAAFPDKEAELPVAGVWVDKVLDALTPFEVKKKKGVYDVPFPTDQESLATLPFDFLNATMRSINTASFPNESEP